LRNGLREAGLAAKVETEPVPTTRLIRVMVIADQFQHMRPSERQDLVWRIVRAEFPPDAQMRISMILTVTRSELKAA